MFADTVGGGIWSQGIQEYLLGGGVCQWVWGHVERWGLFAEMREPGEDLVMKGNICEKGGYVCKGRVEGTEGLTKKDGVWITEQGENRLLLGF